MPKMNGVELFRELRTRHPKLPVILMTAFALEGLVAQALREGVWTLLPKPFDIDHLVAALGNAVRGPAVLIVDDAEPLATATAAALCAVGVRAEAIADGARAVAAVKDGSVDVCVVDMVMPGLSGPEVIERIHQINPAITCIAVSGHDVQDLFRRAASHVHTFLRKPIDPANLAETIARARGKRR
jgi:DNA-binding NtrC family response regulator